MKRSAAESALPTAANCKRAAVGTDRVRGVLESVRKAWSESSSTEARRCAELLQQALASSPLPAWQDPDGLRSPAPSGLAAALETGAMQARTAGAEELATTLGALQAAINDVSWKHPRHLLSTELRAAHSTQTLSLSSLLGGEGRFLSAMLVGSSRLGAHFASDELLMGLTYLAPGTKYPQHAHDAAEVYQMLVGTGQWGPTFDHLAAFEPGSFLFHPSAVSHAICAPCEQPLLAFNAWTGHIKGKFWFCDCCAGNKYLSNINKIASPEDYYDKMADDYEAVVRGWGYCMPEAAVDALLSKGHESMISTDRVLDLGCGDGLVGSALHARGYRLITGSDISAKMLEKASARECYSELHKVDLQEQLPFTAGSFDALLCVGTTTYLRPSVLRDWVRVVRSGGTLVFTHKSLLWSEWELEQSKLVDAGAWQLLWCSEPLHYLPSLQEDAKATPNERAKVYAYRKI